jgi:hypothetical protein
MRCARVGSSKHSPFRIEPETGQVPENVPEPSSPNKESRDVLHDHVPGSNFANETSELRPHPLRRVSSSSGLADDGAREPSTKDIDGNDICPAELRDVVVARNVRPVPSEDPLTELVSFAEPCGSHAGSLEPKVKPAQAGEEASDLKLTGQRGRLGYGQVRAG